MRWQRIIPPGLAAIGGVLGAGIGTVIGAVVAVESVIPSGQAPHESALAGLLYLPGIFFGAGVGGILLAVVGAVVGSCAGVLCTRKRAL